MILGQTRSALQGCRLARAWGCLQPVARGKNREEAGVEHRKEPCPSGRGPAGWARFPARSHFTVRGRYLTHRRWRGRPRRTTSRWGTGGKYETNPIPSKPISINELRWFYAPRARLAKQDILIHGQIR